ncbi:hypothetical protein SE17_31905 [Kouleothrix aurantiaca]|uniref:Endonuclease/exonuclease/phosphatase domain-containing protein n=1 Tax=Kouleothrix aurantiaca TaxID=186479 RepID=A0A0P9FAF8_9CHLR|nr:hypothetical protein SE17_31905 [Kouleothrix aurantiaca]
MPAFSLLTFNCLGAPALSTRHRLAALAQELNTRSYDVVCLQEVQARVYHRMLAGAATAYPHQAAEPFVYAPKGGLFTLARAPFAPHRFTLFRARRIAGLPALMDWALHKGVLATQHVVANTPVVVLNTHLNANYSVNWGERNRYALAEQAQLAELAEIVRAQPPEAVVIAAGDFNIPRDSWLYHEFLQASGMIDPRAGEMQPTHRTPPGIPARFARPIDFAFVRAPTLPGLAIESAMAFSEPVAYANGRRGYLSDHNAIELRLRWADD